MAMISISLDICGSTEAKQRIAQHSKGDARNIDQVIRGIAAQLYNIEANVYRSLLMRSVMLDDLFCIKTVGDETWFVVDIGKRGRSIELNQTLAAVLEALTVACTRRVSASTFNRALSAEEDLNPEATEALPFLPIELPVKVYVDVIYNAIEVSDVRRDVFTKNNPLVMHDRRPTQHGIGDIMDRLVGIVRSDGSMWRGRTDFIGAEVDRFFRGTKAALPAVVTCGETFADLIWTDEAGGHVPLHDGERASVSLVRGSVISLHYDNRCEMVRTNIVPGDAGWKGILHPYSVYRIVPGISALGDILRDQNPLLDETHQWLRSIAGPSKSAPENRII